MHKSIGLWDDGDDKMIGVNDAKDDGPSAGGHDEMFMVDEDIKRMTDLATKL